MKKQGILCFLLFISGVTIVLSQELSGIIDADTTLTAVLSPWIITDKVTISENVTLTVASGCTLYFHDNASLYVTHGGKLLVLGTETDRIIMTRRPGTNDRWNGIEFDGSREENIISYADILFGDGQQQIINIHRAQVVLDHLTWNSGNRTIVEVYHPRAIIQHCSFPGVDEVEVIHGLYLENDEYLILLGNTFGPPHGYNDVIDFTDCKRPGPILEVYDNIFLGGGDDGLDMDGTDAYIEGNTFMHFHKDHTGSSTSNAIATGIRNGKTSDIVVVRNVFYDNDHAVLLKENCYMTAENNTFVKSDSAVINFSEWPYRTVEPGKGVDLVGNIFWDYKQVFENQFSQPDEADPVISVNQCIVDPSVHGLGMDNMDKDPQFIDPHGDFRLSASSPAIGRGPNGLDMGAYVPAGASIAGEPADTTRETCAFLTIGGPGIRHYRYAVNDLYSSWSEEISLADYPVIELQNLQQGQSYTVYVEGKTDAGRWQQSPEYAISKTWTILPTTRSAANPSTAPDFYKLYSAYPNPFNAQTWIRFDLPESQDVKIEIYDALGRLKSTLIRKRYSAGSYVIPFDAANWPSGVYYYRMIAGDFERSQRVVLLR
ncbi:T9SS C-terminal target domain-containing protein [candidate division KSB1 bacterium]|nr:T9SS type A sorting domain-containing protein [candidate division KSB1 bacterium]RQW02705.1 MAG: T9SS C-terminal target domain-containing protein [candidate division KSB1 bacterium]